MSVNMVSDLHIDVLVRALIRRELAGGLSADQIGRRLWRNNVAAVRHRYPDTADAGSSYPGCPAEWSAADAETYHYRIPPDTTQDPQLLLGAAANYRYECSQDPLWDSSAAKNWIDDLRTALLGEGDRERASTREDAGWGIPWRHQEQR